MQTISPRVVGSDNSSAAAAPASTTLVVVLGGTGGRRRTDMDLGFRDAVGGGLADGQTSDKTRDSSRHWQAGRQKQGKSKKRVRLESTSYHSTKQTHDASKQRPARTLCTSKPPAPQKARQHRPLTLPDWLSFPSPSSGGIRPKRT